MKKIFGGIFGKLFVSSIFISASLFLVLLLYTMNGARDALASQKAEDTKIAVGRTDQYLDLYLQNIRNVLLQLDEVYSYAQGQSDNLVNEILENALRSAAQANIGIIGGIYLITPERQTVAGNQLVYDIVGHPYLEELRLIALQREHEAQWTEPYYSPQLTARTVAFVRAVSSGRSPAALVIEVDLEALQFTLADWLVTPGQSYALLTETFTPIAFDATGGIIPVDSRTVPARMATEFSHNLENLPLGDSRVDFGAGTVTAVRSNRNKLGWQLFILIEDSVYLGRINQLHSRFMIIGAVFLIVLVAGTLVVSRHFALPIHRLAVAMDTAGDLSRARVPPIDRRDEIASLYHSFASMITRAKDLQTAEREAIQKRRDVELQLLQSQVRPHFVGNTLACISSLAKQGRFDEVIEMLRSLILLLTTTADHIEKMTTVREEIECLDAYVKLQMMRYGDSFVYECQIDDSCWDFQIPKLLIEPLLENAILHGFADGKNNARVGVLAYLDGNMLIINVRDNGKGIKAERLKSIMDALYADGPVVISPLMPNSTSIGLKNTHERLRMTFDSDSGLSIDSSPGDGTVVTVKIPAITGEKEIKG